MGWLYFLSPAPIKDLEPSLNMLHRLASLMSQNWTGAHNDIAMNGYRLVLIISFASIALVATPAQTKWTQVSSFRFNWNQHTNAQITLEIPYPWSDPGDFTRIRIRVPGRKDFILTNKNGWVKYASEDASLPKALLAKNLARSSHVLALKVAENRTALFLFGYAYASSPGSLDVLELSADNQPRVVLHRDELGLQDVRDLDADNTAEVVGYPCLSQEFGNGLLTYDPFHVYKLGGHSGVAATLSLPLSKAYNLKHYYGWAGAQCREDVAVVLHPPKGKKPVIMSTKEAEKLTTLK